MTPYRGNTILFCSSQQLSPSRVLLPERIKENQGHRHVCRARRGGPRTPSRTTEANLDCAFVENALVSIFPNFGWARAPLSAAFVKNVQIRDILNLPLESVENVLNPSSCLKRQTVTKAASATKWVTAKIV